MMRRALRAVAFAALAAMSGMAGAQGGAAANAANAANVANLVNYPNRALRIVVPLTAGGMVDTVARALAQHFAERLGQPVVVENRVGANGAIAMEAVARAAPDGYTFFYGSTTNFVFLPAARKSLPFDTLKDFDSVSLASSAPFYLVVHPSLDARTVPELIALAKAHPGKYSYATLGRGSSAHLAMEMFRSRAGIDVLHVPYKGSAPALADLLSGQVHIMFEGPTSSLPQIRSGKLRALASSVPKRTQAMPELPTISEAALPGFDISTWNGLAAPAGTPRPIIDRLNALIVEFVRLPASIQRFAASSIDLVSSTPEEMDDRIRRELPFFTKVMRDAGIQPE